MGNLFKKVLQNKRVFLCTLFLISLIPVWSFVIAPSILEIPDDFSYDVDMSSVDNFYDEASGAYKGEQYSKAKFSYEAISETGDVLSIKNTFDVRTVADETVLFVERLYGINAKTGEHVVGFGDKDREGYLFAPRHLKKGEEFVYWHVSNDLPAIMHYVGTEDLYGLKVFKYQTDYDSALIDLTAEHDYLPDVPESRGLKLKTQLELWIEPVSGHLVNAKDYSLDYYYYDINTGEKIAPFNKFSNTFSDDSIQKNVQIAEYQKYKILFIEFFVPFVIFLLILWASNLFKLFWAYLKALPNKVLYKVLAIFVMVLTFIFGALVLFEDFVWIKAIYFAISFLVGCFMLWMQARRSKQMLSFKGTVLMLSVFFGGLLLVYFASIAVNNLFLSQIKGRFDLEVNRVTTSISDSFHVYSTILDGGSGLFYASQSVTDEEWSAYVDSLELDANYPGVKQLDYLDSSDIYGVENPVYKLAMEQARDTGNVTISRTVDSVLMMYVPVYNDELPIDTVDDRQNAAVGYVSLTLNVAEFLDNALPDLIQGIHIVVYDGIITSDENELFVDHHSVEIMRSNFVMDLLQIKTIYVEGLPITIVFSAHSDFDQLYLVPIILIVITIFGLSLLLLSLLTLYSVLSSQQRAILYADEVTRNIEKINLRFQLATDTAQIGVWEWDILNNTVSANRQFYDLYNAVPKDFVKAYEGWFKYLHPDDRARGKEEIKMAFSGKKDFDTTLRALWTNGEIRYIRYFGKIARDKNGEPLSMVGVNWDVTVQKKMEDTKDEFLSIASHELRTPMTAIKGLTSMLISGDYGKVPSSMKEPLADVYSSTERLIHLVNDMLSVSRLEAGRMGFLYSEFDLNDFLDNIISMLSVIAKDKKIKIVKLNAEHKTKPIMVFADPDKMREILNNLIGNAIKFTEKGKVTVSVKDGKEFAEIMVSDTGEGIATENQSKIFGKFQQITSQQKGKPVGSGLGLYISQQLARKMGGDLWLEKSIIKKGSVFCLNVVKSGSSKAKLIGKEQEKLRLKASMNLKNDIK